MVASWRFIPPGVINTTPGTEREYAVTVDIGYLVARQYRGGAWVPMGFLTHDEAGRYYRAVPECRPFAQKRPPGPMPAWQAEGYRSEREWQQAESDAAWMKNELPRQKEERVGY